MPLATGTGGSKGPLVFHGHRPSGQSDLLRDARIQALENDVITLKDALTHLMKAHLDLLNALSLMMAKQKDGARVN